MQTLQQLNYLHTIIKKNNLNILTPNAKQLAIFIKYSALEIHNKNLTHQEKLIMYYLDHLFNISKFFAK